MPQGPRLVQFEGKTQSFPADATDAEISAALNAIPASNGAAVPKAKTWVDTAVDWLPAAGATAGAIALAPTGPVGMALGAGMGSTAARMAKRVIQDVRGQSEAPKGAGGLLDTVAESMAGGAGDAAGALVVGGVGKAAGMAGPALSAAGRGVETAAGSKAAQSLSHSAGVLMGLFGHIPGGVAAYHAPEVGAVAGKALQVAGGALTRRAAAQAGESAVLSAAERAAQIPLRARLAEIPLQDVSEAWQAAKAATPTASIADDVAFARGLMAKGFAQPTAVKIASGTKPSAEHAVAVAKGVMDSLKKRGMPIPEAALKTSGKVAPAVTELMESPTFQALAAHVASLPK